MAVNPLNPNPNLNTHMNEIEGIFRGIVEDNDDPYNICRLRVRVPSINGMPNSKDGIPTDGLPWAAACIPYAGPGYGEVMIPEVGSTVWVMFENNSKSKPVWIGCSYGASTRDGHRDLKTVGRNTFSASDGEWAYDQKREDTPYSFIDSQKDKKVVVRTPKGFEITINERDEDESIDIVDRIGQIIRMRCPTRRSDNANNASARMYGNVADLNMSEGTCVRAAFDDESYILIEAQAKEHDPSYIKLKENDVIVSNGKGTVELFDNQMTFNNGKVRSFYDGEEGTFQITNLPDSVFQMDSEANSIANGSSEVVVKDNEVWVDNGSVGIRLSDAIEFHGPIRWGNGSWGGYWDDDWMRIYYPHIKLATGSASIILDGSNVEVNGDTRIASGRSAVTVDGDVKISGDTYLTDGTASMVIKDDQVKVDSARTRIASGRSAIEVTDRDRFLPMDQDDGDILISGDTKIASGDSSVIVHDSEVDVSSPDTKIADGRASIIVAGHVEANGWIQDTYDDEGHIVVHPHRIGDVTMEDVGRDDVTKDVDPMESTVKGDTSIDDFRYDGWFHGQHIDILPSQ